MTATTISFDGVSVFEDANVPLTKRKKDGSVVDALCWRIDGALHVHPLRMTLFKRMFLDEEEV